MDINCVSADIERLPGYIQENNLAIDKENSKFYNNFRIKGRVGTGIVKGPFDFRIGAGLSVMIEGGYIIPWKYSANGNSKTEGRCEYSTEESGSEPEYRGLGAEASARFSPEVFARTSYWIQNNLDLFLEYSADFSQHTFYMDNSYGICADGDESGRYHMPVDMINQTISLGIEFNSSLNISLGIVIPQIIKENSLAKEAGLSFSPGVHFGITYGFGLGNSK
jgi:hypothetical protein